MSYYGAKELAASFRTVRQNTLQIAEDVPEDQYGFTPAEGARSIARTLVHIALSPQFQHTIHARERRSSFDGFDFQPMMKRAAEDETAERTKSQILDLLKTEGDVWASFLDGVSDDFLAEPFALPPGATPATKSRFEMLLSVKEHEMHHRGQLMVAQRLLGIVPHLTRLREENLTRMRQEHAARTPATSSEA
ncbi:MAG: DinB family protein [Vicinamibacterales bacterium]|jgi:uncharacterized damage-inducible protein DinB|nr:DinB family protein [Vicinamibacterales bacterium]